MPETVSTLLNVLLAGILTGNYVLAKTTGICPFLGVSKKVETAKGMGLAVTFVLVIATIVTYLLQIWVLNPFGLQYLQTIVFILVIAALVQMVEIVLKKLSPSLYQALGVFLPLITTNCCILGVAILVANGTYNGQGLEPNLLTGIIYALATALGFALALIVFAGLREQLGGPFGEAAAALVAAGPAIAAQRQEPAEQVQGFHEGIPGGHAAHGKPADRPVLAGKGFAGGALRQRDDRDEQQDDQQQGHLTHCVSHTTPSFFRS